MDDRHELLHIGDGWRKPVTAGRIEGHVGEHRGEPGQRAGKLLKRVLRDKYAAAFARNEQEISR